MTAHKMESDTIYGSVKQDKNGNKAEGYQEKQEDTIPPTFLRALHDHLRSSLFNQTCADIRIRAFKRTYSLHRVILIQSPFFDSLLNGEFAEAKSRLGVWRRGSAVVVGQTSQQDSLQNLLDKEDDVMELHFDDPNITRPAFEYCIAILYNAAPTLVLPNWATPSPLFPLTRHYEPERLFESLRDKDNAHGIKSDGYFSQEGECSSATSKTFHPANPRFLLSLLATSSYLGIHSLVAQSLTLILCSITPFTVSHYLRFALGYGITGASDAKQRCQADASEWDWELEGPILGMESIAKTDKNRSEEKSSSTLALGMAQMSVSDAQTEMSESVEYEETSFGPNAKSALAGFQYGVESDKIGEACSCWLLRWGADTISAEEQLHMQDESKGMDHLGGVPLLPRGKMPDAFCEKAACCELHVSLACKPPQPIIWRHPLLGGLPANWVRATISSDSFWIREEWERYEAAKRVVSMRRAFSRGDLSNFADGDEEDENEEEEADSNGDEAKIKTTGEDELNQHVSKDDKRNSQHSSRASKDLEESHCHTIDADDEADEAEYTLLFGEGIYYTHMSFDRLSGISNDICPYTGRSYAPISVLQSALWTQSELKNIILHKTAEIEKKNMIDSLARENDDDEDVRGAKGKYSTTRGLQEADTDRELGLVSNENEFVKAYSSIGKRGRTSRSHSGEENKPITLGGVTPLMQPSMSASSSVNFGAMDGLLNKRFFAVPIDDTIRVGENLASLAANQNLSSLLRDDKHENNQANLYRSSDGPTGVAAAVSGNTLSIGNESRSYTSSQFFGMCNAVQLGRNLGKKGSKDFRSFSDSINSPIASQLSQSSQFEASPSLDPSHGWTGFEPMRVGVEFYDVDRLTEKQRSYSPSFFYAGSIWNLYIQTVKKAKGLQLGIYLHRQNNNDTLPSPSKPFRSPLNSHLTGREESEFGPDHALRGGITPDRSTFANFTASASNVTLARDEPRGLEHSSRNMDTSESSAYVHDSQYAPFFSRQNAHLPSSVDGIGHHHHLQTPTQSRSYLRSSVSGAYSLTPSPSGLGDGSGRVVEAVRNPQSNQPEVQTPDVPYLDQRKILRAYFSIHCPSPMGSSLTKFSSRPDNFTLSQSWGWKSSSLLGAVYLEDGQLGTARSQISQTFRCIVTMGIV